MEIKTYDIGKLSNKQFEELRIECRKQKLEEIYRKTHPTAVVEAETGNTNTIIEEYQRKGYLLIDSHFSSLFSSPLHLLVFEKR
ncbi:MAG: hypothetical protein IKX33_08605 [Prevotella sp.]|nr:hypothetical protein [Prevotella sp.]